MLLSTALAAQSKEEVEIAHVVEDLRKAMISGDKKELDRLVAEDLSYGHSGGKVENKDEFIDAIVSGKSDFLTIDLNEQHIQVVGNTVVVRHKLQATTHDQGKEPATVNLAVLLIWKSYYGKWKLLARQAVKISL